MPNKLIDIVGVSKSYGDNLVLDDLNLYIRENEFLTLLGPSGCGKTTLLRILGGFENPDSGKVIFDGKDITSLAPNKRQLNTVFQKYSLFPHMNVYENVAFGLKIKKVPKDEIDKKVKEVLKLVALEGFENRAIDSLSGGQQQRVALASVLVLEPDILVIDEPTSQLDPQETERVFEIIKTMKQMGKTIILVEHKMELVAEYCDEVVVLHQGKVIRHGDKHDVLSEIELEKFGVKVLR